MANYTVELLTLPNSNYRLILFHNGHIDPYKRLAYTRYCPNTLVIKLEERTDDSEIRTIGSRAVDR